MNNIIDPVNGNSYDIFSFEGKNLLKHYVKVFQNGGRSRSDMYLVSESDAEYEVQIPRLQERQAQTTKLNKELQDEQAWCNKHGNILERPYCKCITSPNPNDKDKNGKPNCKEPFLGITRKLTPHTKIVDHYINNPSLHNVISNNDFSSI